MKLPAKTKLGFLLIAAGLGFAVWAVWVRARNATPLLAAGNIGPTFNNDERATEILAKVNTEFAEDDARERLAGYITAARAVRPSGNDVYQRQFSYNRDLQFAYQNSGAHRDLDFATFSSYAAGGGDAESARSDGISGLLNLLRN